MQTLYKEINNTNGMLYGWFEAMHTRIDILFYGDKKRKLQQLIAIIYEEIKQLERIADFYNRNSELYKLNECARKHPIKVSTDLFFMIEDCTKNHKLNGGCFDITIQSDNYDKKTHSSIRLSKENQTVFYETEGIRIDLSGYVKGYALDKITGILKKEGIRNALINMGNSSVSAIGNHPHREGWKVGIQIPQQPAKAKEVCLYNQCLTSSGNNKKDRKHILSPSSGKYIEGIRFISVLTDNGTTGEIVSTALVAATPEQYEQIKRNYKINIIYEIK